MLNIVFCVNDAYMPFVSVTIRSIADTHIGTPVTVHILTDDITDNSRHRLADEFNGFSDLDIVIHVVDDSPLNGLKAWSKYTWYRLLLPSVIPAGIDRVLYLDADTLVCDNLTSLFQTDLDGIAVAGVIDPMTFDGETYRRCGYEREKEYICAGVMLVNLDYWRRNDFQNKMIKWGLENVDIQFHDQDCINYICRDIKKLLPLRYGIIDSLFTIDAIYRPPYLSQAAECIDNPAIIHYAGKAPWFKDAARHPMSDRWYQTNNSMTHPAKFTYKAKGWLRYKIMLWNMTHPNHVRRETTIDGIRSRIENN